MATYVHTYVMDVGRAYEWSGWPGTRCISVLLLLLLEYRSR